MNLSKVLKWIASAKVILPVALALAGVPDEHIAQVVQIVGDSEQALGAGTGQQKLQAVINGVQDTMAASGAAPETVQATTDAITTGLATGIDMVNKIEKIHTADQKTH